MRWKVSGPGPLHRCDGAGCQRAGERFERLRHHGVVGPFAALFAGDQAGVDEQFHVMRHRRLRQADRRRQVADARLAGVGCRDHRQQAHPRRITECFEQVGQPLGSSDVQHAGRDLRAAGVQVVDERQSCTGQTASMPVALTNVDVSSTINTSTFVNRRCWFMTETELREQVRRRYAEAARSVATAGTSPLTIVDADGCCGSTNDSCCSGAGEVDDSFGAALYSADEQGELPAEAVAASLGCGNPTAVADLRAGERVLDLGSGGGIDVLLSARRVGETGFAYGVDMTDEMLDLARVNAAKAGASNVDFLKGHIEDVPLPDAAVDVVISNCVINLSVDKPAVLAEMFRVLTPGGRIGISDVVAEDQLSSADRAERGSYVGCIAGALSRSEYLDGLAKVGFVDADVTFTHAAAPGMHAAIIRASKPVSAVPGWEPGNEGSSQVDPRGGR